jgi:putative intracellular protease/amidase
MTRLLLPVPSYGFDPTEVAIPWKVFSGRGIEVVFATPDGGQGSADELMLEGKNLGIWKPVLRARQDAVDAYSEMQADDSFRQPVQYVDARVGDFDALFLPGGHDKDVKEFLESAVLQRLVADFFAAEKPLGAICHGVVLAARSINPETRKSVIHDYRTTALLKSQERAAYNLTRLWLRDYYLTYPEMTVEDEVRSVLSDSSNFERGPTPVLRDSPDHLERGFVVQDRNYLSARWPGDAYSIATKMTEMLLAD